MDSPKKKPLGLLLTSIFSLLLLAAIPRPVLADCECGYRFTTPATNTTPTAHSYIVTDIIETNFFNITGDISRNTDWVAQNWSEDASVARGAYGEMMNVANVVAASSSSPTKNGGKGNAESDGDEEQGLQITVVSEPTASGDVQGGEIDSGRLDVFYGTFRTSLKLTGVSGTASAFFWVSCFLLVFFVLLWALEFVFLLCLNLSLLILSSSPTQTVLQQHPRNRHGIPLA